MEEASAVSRAGRASWLRCDTSVGEARCFIALSGTERAGNLTFWKLPHIFFLFNCMHFSVYVDNLVKHFLFYVINIILRRFYVGVSLSALY